MRILRHLCKNATPTNVMRQDISDLNSLARRLLQLEQIDNDTFRTHNLLQGRLSLPAVYGGQMFSSVVRAASMTVHPDFLPHSAHAYLIKSGDVNEPMDFKVRRIRDGRSFCTRYVDSFQNGELLTSALVSFHAREEPAVRHQAPMRSDYPTPESLKSWPEVLEDALADKSDRLTPFNRKILRLKQENTPPIFYTLFDIKPIDPLRWTMRHRYPKELAPTHHVYLKANGILGDKQVDHRIAGAFISDINLMEAALVDHIADGFFPTMLFSLDQQVYFHGDFNINEWLLIECTSPVAEGGRAYAEAKAWTLDGRLVMTMPQEGIVRYSKPNQK